MYKTSYQKSLIGLAQQGEIQNIVHRILHRLQQIYEHRWEQICHLTGTIRTTLSQKGLIVCVRRYSSNVISKVLTRHWKQLFIVFSYSRTLPLYVLRMFFSLHFHSQKSVPTHKCTNYYTDPSQKIQPSPFISFFLFAVRSQFT